GGPESAHCVHEVRTERHTGDCRGQARGLGLAGCRDSFGSRPSSRVVRSPRRHPPITMRSVRETNRPGPRSPLARFAERLLLLLLVFGVTALRAGQRAAMLRQQANQARQREREALAMYEVAQLVPGSTLELQPLLGLILDQLKTIVEYDAAAVILCDAAGEP